jgi:M6 family metalloprotease-like protein
MIKKNLTQYSFIILIFCISAVGKLYGAYQTDVPIELERPNGTAVSAFVTGDEFYHWVHDANGFTIIRDETSGELYYAKYTNGKLTPTNLIPGVDDPAKGGLSPNINIPPEQRSIIRDEIEEEDKKEVKENKILSAKTGLVNNIVVYVRFADDAEFTSAKLHFESMHNGTGNSLKAFYNEASYSQLIVNSSFYPISSGTIVVSYQDLYNRDYFQVYHTSQNPNGYVDNNDKRIREHALLKRATEAIASQVPTTLNIDSDNDGKVDNVSYVVRGTPDAWASLLWPHRSWLYTYTVTINGKRVYDYNLNIESMATTSVFTHEFFHTLGAPDLYRYTSGGNPVGPWDIMAQTKNPPQHMTAFMKYKYGTWINSVPVVTSSGVYTLNPLTSSTNNCYRINSPNSTTEYFMVEYRRKTGAFESSVPGSGLIIYRVNTAITDGNRFGPPDEVYVYRLNGTSDEVDGSINSAFFSSGSGRTQFNDNTNPRCFLDNGSDAGISISEIGNAGATISFRITVGIQPPVLDTPGDNAGGIGRIPTFTWGEVEEATTYAIQVSDDINFSTTDIYETGITELSYSAALTDLNNYTTYYWRVYAAIGTESSDWSDVYMFKTLLGPPTIVYPDVDELGVSITPTFEWSSVTGADEYSIEVADNDQFINPLVNADGVETTTYSSAGFQKSKTYYWRVAAWDQFGIGDWSATVPFITELDKPVLLYPVNFKKGIKPKDSLFWIKEFSAEFYDVQISIDDNFSDLALDSAGHDTTNYELNDLISNTEYYWRVRATNEASISPWSDVWNFRTQIDPPELLHPDDDTSGVPLTFTFIWNDVDGVDKYIYELSEYPDFTNVKIHEEDLANNYFEVSGLSSQRRYYWRVASVDEGGESDWSTVFSFLSNIGPPQLAEPSDEAENVPVTHRFRWQAADGANTYQHQLSKDEDFATIEADVDNIKGLTLEYQNIEYAVQYYWRVRSKAAGNVSIWSETWTFNTGALAFGLNKPADQAHEGPLNIKLTWNKTSEIKEYNLLVADDEEFINIIVDEDINSFGEFVVDDLTFGNIYYWKVIGRIDAQEFPTESRILYIDSPAPTHTSPLDGASNQNLNGKVSWDLEQGGKTYSFQLSESDKFGSILQDGEDLTGNFGNYSDLEKSKTYYWRVKQVRDNSESNWSEPWSFSTNLSTPILISPLNNVLTGADGDCLWNEVDLAKTYLIQISESPQFGFTVRQAEDLTKTSYSFTKLPDTLYYWRVKAFDGDAESNWSETGSFEVKTTSVDDDLAAKYKLQLFPNPFSENLDIKLELKNEKYEIEFYDFNGSFITSKSGIGNGTQSIQWNANNLNSGVYLIKFNINGERFTRRVILKK